MQIAAQLTLDFVAPDSQLNIWFGGLSEAHSDNNPILDAITLEKNPDDGNGCDAAGGRIANLVPGLGDNTACDFDPCVAAQNCPARGGQGAPGVSGNVCRSGPGQPGFEACVAGQNGGIANGVRRCGVASQSSIGWGNPGEKTACVI